MFYSQSADPKKGAPAAAAADQAQTAKAKEEPKPAAKSSEAAVDNKPAEKSAQAGNDAASVPKKLEKRNSAQLFLRILVREASLFLIFCVYYNVTSSPLDGSRNSSLQMLKTCGLYGFYPFWYIFLTLIWLLGKT